jgi:predicted metal-binding protein
MAQSLTLEEVLVLTHQGETVETIKYFKCPDCSEYHHCDQCPSKAAEALWLREKESIIEEVRKALSSGELEYSYEVPDLDENVVFHLVQYFEDEFESSGAQIRLVPQCCDECETCIIVDYQNLNPQKKAELQSKKDRNACAIIGLGLSVCLTFVGLMTYFR